MVEEGEILKDKRNRKASSGPVYRVIQVLLTNARSSAEELRQLSQEEREESLKPFSVIPLEDDLGTSPSHSGFPVCRSQI